MREIIDIGPTPSDEPCAQVGSPDYVGRATVECRLFREQLLRVFGPPPPSTLIRTQWSPHDFGQYASVVISFNIDDPLAVEYVQRIDDNAPTHWDEIAKRDLSAIEHTTVRSRSRSKSHRSSDPSEGPRP